MSVLIIAGLLISAPLLIEEEINYFDKETVLAEEKPELINAAK